MRTVNYMLQKGTVSSHRIIGVLQGQHARMVADDLICWAAREYNNTHLQIEMSQPLATDEYSDWQYATVAAVCLEWATRYRFPIDRQHIQAHSEIPPGIREGKTDPGEMWDWEKLVQAFGKSIKLVDI